MLAPVASQTAERALIEEIRCKGEPVSDGETTACQGTHLSQHGVGGQLGQFRRPETNGQDSLTGDPVGVDGSQTSASALTGFGLERTDQDSVRGEQVLDGGTLGQEFGVGQDVELASGLSVGLEDGSHGLGSPARNSRLLDNDFGRVGNLGNSSSSQFDVVQVCGETSAETALLGGGVDGDEDQVGFGDSLVDLGGEEQVSASALLDNVNQSGLVDGKVEVGVVPSINSGLVQVDNGDLDVRTMGR